MPHTRNVTGTHRAFVVAEIANGCNSPAHTVCCGVTMTDAVAPPSQKFVCSAGYDHPRLAMAVTSASGAAVAVTYTVVVE